MLPDSELSEQDYKLWNSLDFEQGARKVWVGRFEKKQGWRLTNNSLVKIVFLRYFHSNALTKESHITAEN